MKKKRKKREKKEINVECNTFCRFEISKRYLKARRKLWERRVSGHDRNDRKPTSERDVVTFLIIAIIVVVVPLFP